MDIIWQEWIDRAITPEKLEHALHSIADDIYIHDVLGFPRVFIPYETSITQTIQ